MQGRGRKFFVANAPQLTDLESREDPSTSAAATEQAPPPPTARSVLKRQVAALKSVHLTQHSKRWQLGCGAGSLSRHGSAERSQQSVVQPGQGQQQQQKEGEDRYLPVDTGSSGDQGNPPSLDDPQNVGPVPLGPWPPDTWIGRDQGPFAPQALNPPPCSSGSRPYPLHTTPPGTPPPSYSPALSPTFAPLFTSSPQSDTDDGSSTTPPPPLPSPLSPHL
ncbi:hypothetical protein PAMP_012816 [Pampus punctatissimus]